MVRAAQEAIRVLDHTANPGETTITLTQDPAHSALRPGSLIVIDPYTVEAELRRVMSIAATVVTLEKPLSYGHSGDDRVFAVTGGLYPWDWWGARPSSTGYAADNVLAFNRCAQQQYDLGGGSNTATAGMFVPPGTWYVNDQLRPERDQAISGAGCTKSLIYAAAGFPFDTTGEVAIIHPQRDGNPVGYAAINNTTRCYIENLYVSGRNLPNANGILIKVQQPNAIRDLLVADCPGMYGMCVMGQDGLFDNIELLGHRVPLVLRGAQMMKFRHFNVEGTTGPANVVIGEGGAGLWNTFNEVHFETNQETVGFDLREGATAFACRDLEYSNPQTGTCFRFDTPIANPGLGCRYVLENIWCNANSQTFKMVDDIQRGRSITSWNTEAHFWIDYLTPRILMAGYVKSP